MSHVPTVLKSDRSVFDKVLPVDDNGLSSVSKGAQWLSGRVLDSRPRGRGFEPHRCYCVVVHEQDTFILA